MADEIGIAMLSQAQYRALQQLGEFDLKTSSWVATPTDVRKLGGALFCDRRYGQVFVYHNGAQSYDAARGFRGALRVCIRAGVQRRRSQLIFRENLPREAALSRCFHAVGAEALDASACSASAVSGRENR